MIQNPRFQRDVTPEMYKVEGKNYTKSKKVQKKSKAKRWDEYNKAVHGAMTDDEWQSRGMIAWPTTPSSTSSTDSQPEVTKVAQVKHCTGGKNRANKDKNRGKGKNRAKKEQGQEEGPRRSKAKKGKDKNRGKNKIINIGKGKNKAKKDKT